MTKVSLTLQACHFSLSHRSQITWEGPLRMKRKQTWHGEGRLLLHSLTMMSYPGCSSDVTSAHRPSCLAPKTQKLWVDSWQHIVLLSNLWECKASIGDASIVLVRCDTQILEEYNRAQVYLADYNAKKKEWNGMEQKNGAALEQVASDYVKWIMLFIESSKWFALETFSHFITRAIGTSVSKTALSSGARGETRCKKPPHTCNNLSSSWRSASSWATCVSFSRWDLTAS